MTETEWNMVFGEYKEQYSRIFEHIYPAKNSTGFPERNLSVNFIRGYEAARRKEKETILGWYEFQFGVRNNRHVDAVLINETSGELFIIESKRYSNPNKKIEEVKEDICRIYDLIAELREENRNGNPRISLKNISAVYGVILADAWKMHGMKTRIIQSYQEKKFCEDFLKRNDIDPIYDVQDFEEIKEYKLLSFTWKL